MADQKDVCSPSVRAPKLQLAAEQPSAGDRNPATIRRQQPSAGTH